MIMYCPSMVAASAVYAARCTLKKSPLCTETLKRHTGFSEQQLLDCAQVLVKFHSVAHESKLRVVYKKYSNEQLGAVALNPPATKLIEDLLKASKTIATVCIFLASKVEDTPCALDYVVRVAYETMYRRDSTAARRIYQKDVFEKQKALILIGERLLLSTIRFDFNVQHPYKPLLDALNKLRITCKDVRQVAWNFVNDWLRTTLCLQYKPHYIAAGSLFLAAKFHNVKLPSGRGYAWWNEFDVNPRQLEAVIRHMMELYGSKQRSVATPHLEKPITEAPAEEKQQISSSPDSVLSGPGFSTSSSCHDLNAEEGGSQRDYECSTSNGAVEKGLDQVDVCRIKELMKRRKRQREEVYGKAGTSVDCSEDVWIEREIEDGIVPGAESSMKKQKLL